MPAKMMLYNVVLLLIYWPCVRSIKIDHVTDQIAIASENRSPLRSKIPDHHGIPSLSISARSNDSLIHYENSNGFVPMLSNINHDTVKSVRPINYNEKYSKNLSSNDVKLIFNNSYIDANRRLDSQSDQKDFEILKVNGKIPAVANYHEFYDNLRNNKKNHDNQKNYDNHNLNYPINNFHNVKPNYYRNKERFQQIENYLNNNNNQQYSTNGNIKNVPSNPTYNQGVLQNNNNKYNVNSNNQYGAAANRDVYAQNNANLNPTNSPLINYHNSDNANNNNYNYLNNNYNNNNNYPNNPLSSEKPVVVVEPSNYNVNLNYNSQPPIKSNNNNPLSSEKYERNLSEDRYDRNEEYFDDNGDYYEVSDQRKLHKSRRKHPSDSSRKLPKEHRDDSDELKKTNAGTRSKLHRGRGKPSHWSEEDHLSQEEYSGETNKENRYRDKNKAKQQDDKEKSNAWSQVGPNVEFTQSNAFELGQIDKPNVLVPVNFNLVPVSNFGQTTGIGNNQGVDVSNVGVHNFISPGTIVSTAAPLVNSNSPIMMQTTPSTPLRNIQHNYAYPTVSDIVVGQNSFQTPVQTLIVPQHNKFNPNVKAFLHSTPTPLYSINPTIHSLATIQNSPTPKTGAIASQVTGPQLFYSTSTVQPLYDSPISPGTNYNIVVNPYSVHGQNTPTTTLANHPASAPLSSGDSHPKKGTFSGSNGQFLASASFSVGSGEQSRHNNNGNSNTNNNNNYNNNNHNNHHNNKYYLPLNNVNNNILAGSQANAQILRPQVQPNMYPVYKTDNPVSKIKTFVPAHVVPAFIQATPVPGVNLINQGQPQGQQYVNVGNNILENTWKQLQQLQSNEHQRFHIFSGKDAVASTSNTNVNTVNLIPTNKVAQLPVVGMQNVEILNPNLSPITAQIVPQYPAAVVTTPIPIVSTPAGFVASAPMVTPTIPVSNNIQHYVDSLTHIGTRPVEQNPIVDSSVYNPMNFVPNVDLIKSQTLLNGKLPEPLPPSLNLVPILPDGKFFKHSHAAQSDLITKPKLSSDLEKYAEEMFKESIRTIYNTHKWNTDKKINNLTYVDGIDYAKLKKELERLKATMATTKNGKEILEAHHSEQQFQAADPLWPKKPGLSVAALEELLKSGFKLKSQSGSYSSHKPSETMTINDYLTPPRANSFGSSSSFIDKPKKKRQKSRQRQTNHKSRPNNNLDTSASYVTYHRRPHHNRNNYGDYRGKENYLDNYPTFTTSSPDLTVFQLPNNRHAPKSDMDFNLPRTHNLLGWLMKSKQLPAGASTSTMNASMNSGDNDYQYFLDDNRRIHNRNFSPSKLSSPSYMRFYQQKL